MKPTVFVSPGPDRDYIYCPPGKLYFGRTVVNLNEFAEANGFGRIDDGVTDCTAAFTAAMATVQKP